MTVEFGRLDGRLSAVTIFSVLLFVFALICYFAISGSYLPTSSDEVDYVKSVEYFVFNGRPEAFSTFDGLYAAGGDFSFHGPIYPVIFGAPQMVVGAYSQSFILYANIALSVAVLAIAWTFLKSDRTTAALCCSIILSSPVFLVYSITYMMEPLQIMIAVIFAVSFSFLIRRPSLLMIASAAFGTIRQSNFLYAVPAPLQSRNVPAGIVRFVALAALFTLLLFETSYLHAPFPDGKFQAASKAVANRDFGALVEMLVTNLLGGVRAFLFTSEDGLFYAVARYVFLALTIACLVWGHLRKDTMLSAAGFVGASYALALWILYDVGSWRDLRSLAGVTIFLVIILARVGLKNFLWAVLAAQLVAYPGLYAYRDAFTNGHVLAFKERLAAEVPLVNAYRSLSSLTQPLGATRRFLLIGIEQGLFSTEMSPELFSLPVRSEEGLPIRYTFEWQRPVGDDEVDYLVAKEVCRFGKAVAANAYFEVCPMKSPAG